jgi:hypothetical protein
MAFRAYSELRVEVPVLVEVRQLLCAFTVSADSLLYHFGSEGRQPCDLYKPLPVVFLLQPSQSYAPETQLLASSLLGLWRGISSLRVAFPLLGLAKSLFWSFLSNSR